MQIDKQWNISTSVSPYKMNSAGKCFEISADEFEIFTAHIFFKLCVNQSLRFLIARKSFA